ncbi:helix-turn-helix domain-containing protein [Actinomadura algeriensis]|uniref:Transcriptional regulator with XRE-family HTH domain n=1 Tax=Actinomadura algeriensis TaxID=1679523 RepID=A0ABR9JIK2_9ACTN|nr:helix-turn-helix transcriptional regulator [Actinomadura algeriensis]MBE1530362.1 transcriptional regulator with XRE-family HTH domain [Actinomadura algeriensis]
MPSGDLTRDPLIRVFGAVLRSYREAAKLTRPQLAEALGCTYQWIEKLETGTKPSIETAIDLDTFFAIKENTFRKMADEIERAGKQAMLPPGFPAFLKLEERALSIRSFVCQVVPGLLQTADYARGVMGAGQVRDGLDELVAQRVHRQRILERERPTRLAFVLDESVLRRPIGGPGAMHDQLAHLEYVIHHEPHIQIRMLPFERITWASLDGSFTILKFGDGPDVAYLEGPTSSQLLRDPDRVADTAVRFDLVMGEALTGSESLDMIRHAREGYRDQP